MQAKTSSVCLSFASSLEYNAIWAKAPHSKNRATYAQGGILAKGSLYSGINKCIMCFCTPQIKEVSWNLEKIFNLMGMDQVFLEYENVIFTGDLKLLNEVYGLMEAGSNHPCIYCTALKQELEAGPPRTIGSLRSDFKNGVLQVEKRINVKSSIM